MSAVYDFSAEEIEERAQALLRRRARSELVSKRVAELEEEMTRGSSVDPTPANDQQAELSALCDRFLEVLDIALKSLKEIESALKLRDDVALNHGGRRKVSAQGLQLAHDVIQRRLGHGSSLSVVCCGDCHSKGSPREGGRA